MLEIENIKLPQLRGPKIRWGMCYENCIATYAYCYGLNYQIMFINALRMSYHTENEKTNECWRNIRFNTNKMENLYKYTGIIQNYYESGIEEIKKACCEDKMCMTIMDTYYCTWNRFYTIEHRKDHNFLIYHYENKKFYCTDPTVGCAGMILNEELLDKSYCSHIELSNKKRDEDPDYIELIKNEAVFLLESGKYLFIENFIEQFKEQFKNANVADISIVLDVVEDIERNIVEFAILLEYVSNKYQNYNEILKESIARLLKMSNIWRIIRLELLQYEKNKDVSIANKSIIYGHSMLKAIKMEYYIMQALRNI